MTSPNDPFAGMMANFDIDVDRWLEENDENQSQASVASTGVSEYISLDDFALHMQNDKDPSNKKNSIEATFSPYTCSKDGANSCYKCSYCNYESIEEYQILLHCSRLHAVEDFRKSNPERTTPTQNNNFHDSQTKQTLDKGPVELTSTVHKDTNAPDSDSDDGMHIINPNARRDSSGNQSSGRSSNASASAQPTNVMSGKLSSNETPLGNVRGDNTSGSSTPALIRNDIRMPTPPPLRQDNGNVRPNSRLGNPRDQNSNSPIASVSLGASKSTTPTPATPSAARKTPVPINVAHALTPSWVSSPLMASKSAPVFVSNTVTSRAGGSTGAATNLPTPPPLTSRPTLPEGGIPLLPTSNQSGGAGLANPTSTTDLLRRLSSTLGNNQNNVTQHQSPLGQQHFPNLGPSLSQSQGRMQPVVTSARCTPPQMVQNPPAYQTQRLNGQAYGAQSYGNTLQSLASLEQAAQMKRMYEQQNLQRPVSQHQNRPPHPQSVQHHYPQVPQQNPLPRPRLRNPTDIARGVQMEAMRQAVPMPQSAFMGHFRAHSSRQSTPRQTMLNNSQTRPEYQNLGPQSSLRPGNSGQFNPMPQNQVRQQNSGKLASNVVQGQGYLAQALRPPSGPRPHGQTPYSTVNNPFMKGSSTAMMPNMSNTLGSTSPQQMPRGQQQMASLMAGTSSKQLGNTTIGNNNLSGNAKRTAAEASLQLLQRASSNPPSLNKSNQSNQKRAAVEGSLKILQNASGSSPSGGHLVNQKESGASAFQAHDGQLFMMKQMGAGYILTPYDDPNNMPVASGSTKRININSIGDIKDSDVDPEIMAYLNGKLVPKNVRFKCKLCSAKTDLLNMIRWHLYASHLQYAPKPFNCLRCKETFFSVKHAEEHARSVHNVNKCHQFDESITQIAQKHSATMFKMYTSIVIEETVSANFECQICSIRTADNKAMRVHMETMHNPFKAAAFQCWYCPECADEESKIKDHVQKVHTNQPSQYTRDQPPGKKREKITSRLMEFSKELSAGVNSVKTFTLSEQPPEKVEEIEMVHCALCTFGTVQLVTLENHLKNDHLPFRPYICHGNDFRAATIKMLKKHLAQAHPEWLQGGSLHKRVSIDGELSACQDRETKQLVLKSLAKSLENVPSSEEVIHFDHQCSECGFKTDAHLYLENHIKLRHLLATPYICRICGMATALRVSIFEHFAKKHPQETDISDLVYTDEFGESIQDEEAMKLVIKSICNNSDDQGEEIHEEEPKGSTDGGKDTEKSEKEKNVEESGINQPEKSVVTNGGADERGSNAATPVSSSQGMTTTTPTTATTTEAVSSLASSSVTALTTALSSVAALTQPLPSVPSSTQSTLSSSLPVLLPTPVVSVPVQSSSTAQATPLATQAVSVPTVTLSSPTIPVPTQTLSLPLQQITIPVQPSQTISLVGQTFPVQGQAVGLPNQQLIGPFSLPLQQGTPTPITQATALPGQRLLLSPTSGQTITLQGQPNNLVSPPFYLIPVPRVSGPSGTPISVAPLSGGPVPIAPAPISQAVRNSVPSNISSKTIPSSMASGTVNRSPTDAAVVKVKLEPMEEVADSAVVSSNDAGTRGFNTNVATPVIMPSNSLPVASSNTPGVTSSLSQFSSGVTVNSDANNRPQGQLRAAQPSQNPSSDTSVPLDRFDSQNLMPNSELSIRTKNRTKTLESPVVSVTSDEDAFVLSIPDIIAPGRSREITSNISTRVRTLPTSVCSKSTLSISSISTSSVSSKLTPTVSSKLTSGVSSKSSGITSFPGSVSSDMSRITSLFTGEQRKGTLTHSSPLDKARRPPVSAPESPEMERAFKCYECEDVYTKWPELRQHIIQAHLEEFWPFFCEPCNFRTYSFPNMREHMATVHRSNEMVKVNKDLQSKMQAKLGELQKTITPTLVPRKSTASDDAKRTKTQRMLSCNMGDIRKRLNFRKSKSKSRDPTKDSGSKSPIIINQAVLNAPIERMQSIERTTSVEPDYMGTCTYCQQYTHKSTVEVQIPLMQITLVNNKECLLRCDCDFSSTNIPVFVFHIWSHTDLNLYHCGHCKMEGNEKKDMGVHCKEIHGQDVPLHQIRLFKSMVKFLERHLQLVVSKLLDHYSKRPILSGVEEGDVTDIKKSLFKCSHCSYQSLSLIHVVAHEQDNHSVKIVKVTLDFRASMDNGLTERLQKGSDSILAPASETPTAGMSNENESQHGHIKLKLDLKKGKRKSVLISDSDSSDSSAPSRKRRRGSYPRESKVKECHMCPYSTDTNKDLEMHLLKNHTVIRPYKCSECTKSYLCKEEARNHIHRRHANRAAKLVINKQMEVILNEARESLMKYAKRKQEKSQEERNHLYKRIRLSSSEIGSVTLAPYVRKMNDPKLKMLPVVKLKDVKKSKRFKKYMKKKA